MSRGIANAGHLQRSSQRGVTLVEMLIAVLIGLFLLGGLLTLVGAMKRTSKIQTSLSLLHDSERFAMSLVTDVVQSAGYFPLPLGNTTNTAVNQMLAVTVTAGGVTVPFVAGQMVGGKDGGTPNTAETDTFAVRYMTTGGDGIINCTGGTSATQTTWISTFYLDANHNFVCAQSVQTNTAAVTALPVTLISGVQYLSVVYGVRTSTAAGSHSVDTYLTASQVTAGSYWPSVMSVKVTFYLINPLAGQPGQTATAMATIPFTRVIALMSQVGINT